MRSVAYSHFDSHWAASPALRWAAIAVAGFTAVGGHGKRRLLHEILTPQSHVRLIAFSDALGLHTKATDGACTGSHGAHLPPNAQVAAGMIAPLVLVKAFRRDGSTGIREGMASALLQA